MDSQFAHQMNSLLIVIPSIEIQNILTILYHLILIDEEKLKMDCAFLAFDAGPRSSPGALLATTELVLTIVKIAHKCSFKLACDPKLFTASVKKLPLQFSSRK